MQAGRGPDDDAVLLGGVLGMGGLAGNLQVQPDVGANISSYSASAFALLSSNFTANRAAMSGGAVFQARWLIL